MKQNLKTEEDDGLIYDFYFLKEFAFVKGISRWSYEV